MISDRTLDTAVAQALISAEQAAALRRLEGQAASASPGEDENLRLITGFADIFVTIGLILFLGALSYFAGLQNGSPGMTLLVAAVCWGLAEFFTRRQRMALPSIVLLIAYAALIFLAGCEWADLLSPGSGSTGSGWPHLSNASALIVAGFMTVAAVALHYLRFGVPITVAAGAAALIAIVLGTVLLATGIATDAFLKPTLLVCGVLVFLLAMRFDMSDPVRATRRTDIAFWLHLLAAPLIVHTLVGGIATRGDITPVTAALILAIFAGLAIVAVLIDRRAILVSGLSYAGYAFGTLMVKAGAMDVAFPLTVLVLGALILLLSAGWHALRKAAIPLLPQALARHLPRTYMGTTKTG